MNAPEFVIRVSHLVRSKFGHKDFYDMDEDEKVDLGETKQMLKVVLVKNLLSPPKNEGTGGI